MLGLAALGLTTIMIYTLVKNALVGKQLSGEETFSGTSELIIPITNNSEFYLDPWIRALDSLQRHGSSIRIHLLVDGYHPMARLWEEMKSKLPYVEIHTFITRPHDINPVPWMIDQIAPKITGQVVILGDSELVPSEHAFSSIGNLITQKKKPFYILPQTVHLNTLGQAISVLNPSLALVSVFGFRKLRRSLSHPLMSLSQGWLAMPLETFKELSFKTMKTSSWKLGVVTQWQLEGKKFLLAFGEKYLLRYYPENLRTQILSMKEQWSVYWKQTERGGFWIYLVTLFLWSFPILFFPSHPFWSIASIFLLLIYRFFSKVVFQESWSAVFLHPVGCLAWIGTFIWWVISGLKSGRSEAISKNY